MMAAGSLLTEASWLLLVTGATTLVVVLVRVLVRGVAREDTSRRPTSRGEPSTTTSACPRHRTGALCYHPHDHRTIADQAFGGQ